MLDLDYFNKICETYDVDIDISFIKWPFGARDLAITIRHEGRNIKRYFDISKVENVHITTVIDDMLVKLGVKEAT